jgi:hypothetical protein
MQMPVLNSPERLWRTEFDKQLTDDMMERVIKQSMVLARKVERRTPWRDRQTADDRLHGAIVKILDGTLKWQPERVDLERFLLGAVAGEISHEVEHAQRFLHVSLDDDARNQELLEAETSDAIAEERVVKNEVPMRAWWSDVIGAIRKHARGDLYVLAILGGYDDGKLTRREVLACTGMTSKQYHAAYQRLMRAAQKVDADVRELIAQAIA